MPGDVDGERDRKADEKRWKDKKKMGHIVLYEYLKKETSKR
jgi:hypothetical protein